MSRTLILIPKIIQHYESEIFKCYGGCGPCMTGSAPDLICGLTTDILKELLVR